VPAPVIVDFILRGMPEVTRAFRTVEQAATAAGRTQTSVAQRGARERVSLAEREAREKVAAMRKADAATKSAQDRAVREVTRAAAQRAKAEEKAERDAVRAAEKSANDRIRIQQRVDREFMAMQKRQQAERDRVIREDDRREERAAQSRAKIRERSATMAGRYASAQAAEQQRNREAFQRGIGGGIAKGFTGGVSAIAGGAMHVAGMVGQLGGGFSIADSVTREANLRKKAAVISANTILSGAGQKGADASLGKAMGTNEILARAKAIGVEQNIDPADVLGAIDEIKKLTGNVEKATNVAGKVAKLSTATGGDVKEMSGLAANILAANPNIADKDLDRQMRIFAKQGVVGGVEVADMAKYGSRITAGASMYGGNKEQNEATLGAMSQMARQYGSAGTAAEATLGSLRFSTDVAKHADKLKAGGIDVSDHKGNLKDAQSILLDMLKKTGGDVTKLAHLGLGDRGVKPLEGVANIYKNAGGGDKGMAAVKAEFAKYTSGISEDEVEAANKRILAEQQAEIEIKKLQIAFGEQLLPALAKLVPVLRDAMPTIQRLLEAFVRMAEWAGSNPLSAMGATMALSISKSVAEAGIGMAVKNALESSLGSKGGLVLASGTIAVTSAMIAVETIAQKQAADVSKEVGASGVAYSDAAGVRRGDRTTKSKVNDLVAERDRMQKQVEKERAGVNSMEAIEYVGLLGKAASYTPVGAIARAATGNDGVFSDMDQSAAYQKSREDRLKQSEQALEAMNRAIVVATKNLEMMGRVPPPTGGGDGGKPGGAAASTGIVQRTQ